MNEYLPGFENERRKRQLSQFHTPPDTAERIAQFAFGCMERAERPLRVLEPSAGDGALVRACLEYSVDMTAVEIDPDRREQLVALLGEDRVHTADFTTWDTDQRFDLGVMNPPFEDGQYEVHVMRALRFCRVVIAHIPLACFESDSRRRSFWPHVTVPRVAVCASRPKYLGEGGKTAMCTLQLASCAYRDVSEPQPMTMEIW